MIEGHALWLARQFQAAGQAYAICQADFQWIDHVLRTCRDICLGNGLYLLEPEQSTCQMEQHGTGICINSLVLCILHHDLDLQCTEVMDHTVGTGSRVCCQFEQFGAPPRAFTCCFEHRLYSLGQVFAH
ncbi:hypothetical protein D3C86_1837220 [compost metagenome]